MAAEDSLSYSVVQVERICRKGLKGIKRPKSHKGKKAKKTHSPRRTKRPMKYVLRLPMLTNGFT
jgi:hypothetical protein